MKIKFILLLLCSTKLLLNFNELVSFNNLKKNDLLIFFTSIPKSGSNLLRKCLEILTKRKSRICCLNQENKIHNKDCALYLQNLDVLHMQQFIYWEHLPFDFNLIQISDHENFKTFFILRDPRDQVISQMHYMRKIALWSKYNKMTDSEVLLYLINDNKEIYSYFVCSKNEKYFSTINEFYNLFLEWKNVSFSYCVVFEKLIGPKGGGDLEAQLNEIQNIARHIGMDITRQRAKQISDKLFGGTSTFRAGQIGDWKKHFTEEHKKAFKEVAGQLLIDLGYEQDFDW